MKATYTYQKLDELIKALEACEMLGFYYKVEKTITTGFNNVPLDEWRLEIDL